MNTKEVCRKLTEAAKRAGYSFEQLSKSMEAFNDNSKRLEPTGSKYHR